MRDQAADAHREMEALIFRWWGQLTDHLCVDHFLGELWDGTIIRTVFPARSRRPNRKSPLILFFSPGKCRHSKRRHRPDRWKLQPAVPAFSPLFERHSESKYVLFTIRCLARAGDVVRPSGGSGSNGR